MTGRVDNIHSNLTRIFALNFCEFRFFFSRQKTAFLFRAKNRRQQGCPWIGTRNKFQSEFAFFLEPERFGINFLLTGTETGIPKSQINFVHENFFTVNCAILKYGNSFAACAITKCRQ